MKIFSSKMAVLTRKEHSILNLVKTMVKKDPQPKGGKQDLGERHDISWMASFLCELTCFVMFMAFAFLGLRSYIQLQCVVTRMGFGFLPITQGKFHALFPLCLLVAWVWPWVNPARGTFTIILKYYIHNMRCDFYEVEHEATIEAIPINTFTAYLTVDKGVDPRTYLTTRYSTDATIAFFGGTDSKLEGSWIIRDSNVSAHCSQIIRKCCQSIFWESVQMFSCSFLWYLVVTKVCALLPPWFIPVVLPTKVLLPMAFSDRRVSVTLVITYFFFVALCYMGMFADDVLPHTQFYEQYYRTTYGLFSLTEKLHGITNTCTDAFFALWAAAAAHATFYGEYSAPPINVEEVLHEVATLLSTA